MTLIKYDVFILNEDAYWFMSTGKQGQIYKGVLFQPLPDANRYNLALADIDLQKGLLEFETLSGNGDARKIFATIGEIVDKYTEDFPEREILFSGNTADKKRTYSFMVSHYLEEIETKFEVSGIKEGESFEKFLKNKIYDDILVKRK